ncbi:MAG TPA: ABC transporter permease [Longimicrobium sp.]|jgi:predicted permease
MDSLIQDLRYAIRTLLRSPGFTLVAVLTLALGIGANTAIFSVVNGVILRPLPYPQPEQLRYLAWQWKNGSATNALTGYQFEYWREHARSFAGAASFDQHAAEVAGGGFAQGLRGTDEFLGVLGVKLALGRGFLPEENRPGGPRAVIVGDGMWRTRLGADPRVVGRTLMLDGEPHTIVGVLPATFRFPQSPEWTEFVLPLRLMVDREDQGHNSTVVARLRAGVTPRQAEAEMAALSERFRRENPELAGAGEGVALVSYGSMYLGGLRTVLWVLLGAVGVVLLIACVNVANLLLARAARRHREMAVRAAVGAGRGRIVRQVVTEGVVLALLAGAAGLAVGAAVVRALLALAPQLLPRTDEIGLDARVLAFTLLVALGTGVVAGLASALPAARTDLAGVLRGASQPGGGGRGARVLVAAEAALAVVLLVGAGLLAGSLARMSRVDPGFRAEHLLTARIPHVPEGYGSAARSADFADRVMTRVQGTPGVVSVAAVSAIPFQRGMNIPVTVEGRPEATEGAIEWRAVTPGYFRTLGIPLAAGRDFAASDAGGAPVIAVNESAARRYWPGRTPLGDRLRVGAMGGKPIPELADVSREIVGVVRDIRDQRMDLPPRRTVFVPMAQVPDAYASLPALLVRTTDPASTGAVLRQAIREADPRMPAPELRMMEEVVGATLAQSRFNTLLMGSFALLAMLLTGVGIFGVVSYTVRQRTREIGVRMALGARQSDVLGAVVRQGIRPAVVGLVVGLVAAAGLSRLVAGMLYEVSPTDPLTLGAVSVALVGVALLASYLPARRAARVDPIIALRSE